MEKTPSGAIFRTSDMEERARRKYEESRQSRMEKLCSEMQAQMEKEEDQSSKLLLFCLI